MRVYEGRNGRRVGIDLAKLEAVFEECDGHIDLFTSSDRYRIVASFDDVMRDWREDTECP